MEQYFVLNKSDFDDFISRIAKMKKLVGPVKRGESSYAFEELTSGNQVSLEYIPTILPPKKYFLPQNETLVEYNKKMNKWTATLYSEELVIFGVHTCDLAGIQCLNIVFSERPMDVNYNIRKNRILIIGLECNDYCDDYASCGLMDTSTPNGGYDLFFTDLGDKFAVHVNTYAGEELIGKLKMLKKADFNITKEIHTLRKKKREIFKPEVDIEYKELKTIFENAQHHEIWHDIHEKCLSCGNCTNICPTCYCYDMEDIMDIDMKNGKLVRKWDSCQNRPFAMIAGGENFRPERGGRQRHRYMRKFNYPYDRYSRYFCTGCGRCSRTCMAKISLKETISTINESEKEK